MDLPIIKLPIDILTIAEEIRELSRCMRKYKDQTVSSPSQKDANIASIVRCSNRAEYLRRKIINILIRTLAIRVRVQLTGYVGSSNAVSAQIRYCDKEDGKIKTEYKYLGRGYWTGKGEKTQYIDFEKLVIKRAPAEEILTHLIRAGHLTKFGVMKGGCIVFRNRLYRIVGKIAKYARIRCLYDIPTIRIGRVLVAK